MQKNSDHYDDEREFLLGDLYEFAQYINPFYSYGDIHRRVFEWLSADKANAYQLLLLPRDHLKSHCIAVWCVWQITREPWSTIVYLSAGEDLAVNQVYAIKNMFLSDNYRKLWPEMINEAENDRDKWSAFAINVDHPERSRRGIRDNTIIVKTVKSNATGLHCSHLVLDDVVVPKFAYTKPGRNEVQQSVAQFASIKSTEAITKAVGTRYHPKDLYEKFINAKIPVVDEETGELLDEEALWEIMEYKVETNGDGFGDYLWPRVYNTELGTWFGFDFKVLMYKKAEYLSLGQEVQFYSQYYNEPNDESQNRVDKTVFQYYDQKHLNKVNGKWFYRDSELRVFAGMDVAFTDMQSAGGKAADFTAIAVIGIDSAGFIYILALDRFKTDDYSVYYDHVIALAKYWNFKKIVVETNTGGSTVRKALENLVREDALSLVIEGKPATKSEGSKFERHAAVVEPRYKSKTMWHFEGGLTPALEEEIIQLNPPNDDLEDAVAIAIEQAKPPPKKQGLSGNNNRVIQAESRFGGRRRIRGNRIG